MNAAHPVLRPLVLGSLVLWSTSTLAGCDSSTKPAPSASASDSKAADAKAADSKASDAKASDAKAGDAKASDAKAADSKAADAKEASPEDTNPVTVVAAKTPQMPKAGMLPPEGMTPEQLKEFAAASGDPTGGTFTLEQAFAGDPDLADKSKGKLMAAFETTMGSFECELYEDDVPLTVANFVGLARGTRPTWDKKRNAWVTKRYYDGNIFHRVIKNFMIQTGDDSNSGRGNPGYVLADEFVKKLVHDSAGVLSMANRSKPNTGSTQFFITVRDTKHLDGKHAVFGKCADASVPIEISNVKVDHRAGDRPYEQIKIDAVKILRK
ncbi:peptidylprolyl isomerase [Paraliomyxa miuraensis]|uniref:peptidylprolyl isomerase n=1 Tax=Paraliomyxa miuraensis TaxID=376150 RepID=UPI00224E071A|nr:peptidylprolyl isomerase [Paraliomyxa miuraensis]MCX4245541.1 peptidylprolyl isomerase [Paraliomyxa miuraensis]